MIDWTHVRKLRDEIGGDAFEEVVELFLDEVETEISNLRGLPGTVDLGAQLHFIKGSALNLGFVAFSDLCHSGEAAAEAGHVDDVNLAQIVECFDRSKATFLVGLDKEVTLA